MSKESRLARRAVVLARLAESVERIKRKDVRIARATQFAAHVVTRKDEETGDIISEIPDVIDGHRLTPFEKRVALDARNSKRDAPMYLELASKRYEVQQKLEALKTSATPLNAQAIAFVIGNADATARYPVIDVEVKETATALPALPEPEKKGDADGKGER